MIAFILNLPFTLTGIIPAILSLPYEVRLVKAPFSIVVKVRKFWWGFNFMKNARAMTIGYIILLSPKIQKNDFEHELIHVKQCQRYPLIYPFLYLYELLQKGYRENRFEDQAYELSKSIYKGGK